MSYDRNSVFRLSPEQWAKYDAWRKETNEIKREAQRQDIEQRRERIERDCTDQDDSYLRVLEMAESMGHPYDGAVGGAYTFEFTETSIGTLVTVNECVTKRSLDLTEDM